MDVIHHNDWILSSGDVPICVWLIGKRKNEETGKSYISVNMWRSYWIPVMYTKKRGWLLLQGKNLEGNRSLKWFKNYLQIPWRVWWGREKKHEKSIQKFSSINNQQEKLVAKESEVEFRFFGALLTNWSRLSGLPDRTFCSNRKLTNFA